MLLSHSRVVEQVLKLLKPSGKVAAVVVEDSDGVGGELVTKRALTFAGFLSVTAYPGESRLVTGERPEWAMGASAPVRLTFRKPVTVSADSNDASDEAKGKGNAASEDGGTSKWKVSLDDDDVGLANGGGDDDLVDEDALLEASAPVKRASEQVSQISRRARNLLVFSQECLSLKTNRSVRALRHLL